MIERLIYAILACDKGNAAILLVLGYFGHVRRYYNECAPTTETTQESSYIQLCYIGGVNNY